MWQVSQAIGVPAPFKAMCAAWAPATFGYEDAAPLGGFAWQETQLIAVSGDPAMWHVWQTGPDLVEVPETSWQTLQLEENVEEDTP
ncbi:MAG: hypothetical protein CO109_13145 [Deltaproteobacteria bacterium CG_4_9_14_3_um_filter_65_9]|nr:MAG: hypothetical protein CO109_13145 [Deltaproteobacteria bacterium CG_4_9_14_3_um_filter_65_9]